ncbi:MAG: hypothetical protein OSA99_09075, partial [Acidimicrobiales bacterium]|nr:hypothetical protein [Acidimicrobiales bacterium]
MTGPAFYSRDADVAEAARAKLDVAAASVADLESVQCRTVGVLVELWPDSAWIAAGVRTAKQWLITYTGLSAREAKRLEKIAELCSRHAGLCAAVVDGRMSLGRAEKLAWAITPERAPWLAGIADTFVRFAGTDDEFDAAVRYWRERVDEHLAPRRV